MDKFKQQSIHWINSRETGNDDVVIKVTDQEDTENTLNFSASCPSLSKSFSFSVTCPDVNNEESREEHWSVWSDDSLLQVELQLICDFCDSGRQKTIADILNKMDAALKKVVTNEIADNDDDEDDDNLDDYYGDNTDDEPVPLPTRQKESDSEDEDQENFFGSGASPAAFQRLAKDMKALKQTKVDYINGSPRENNLFIWDVKLSGIPKETQLGKDIMAWSEKYKREPVIYLEMQFPSEYPMAPPFVRVIRPRFKFLTGHVTIGGSICMQMLTKSGWTPTNDIEGILVQIHSEILSDTNTRLDSNPDKAYDEREARDAFRRMVERYKW